MWPLQTPPLRVATLVVAASLAPVTGFSLGSPRVGELQGAAAFNTALAASADALSVVCFTSPLCRKCRAFAPRFEQLAVSQPGISVSPTFYRINTLQNIDLFESQGISTLPTVAFYVGRELVSLQAVGRDVRADAAGVVEALAELQALPPAGLKARAACAREWAQQQAASPDSQRSSEFLFGALATGGAFVRLVAAMGEFGFASEVTTVTVGLEECALECAANLETLGEALGP